MKKDLQIILFCFYWCFTQCPSLTVIGVVVAVAVVVLLLLGRTVASMQGPVITFWQFVIVCVTQVITTNRMKSENRGWVVQVIPFFSHLQGIWFIKSSRKLLLVVVLVWEDVEMMSMGWAVTANLALPRPSMADGLDMVLDGWWMVRMMKRMICEKS